jgi:hypothetical protein
MHAQQSCPTRSDENPMMLGHRYVESVTGMAKWSVYAICRTTTGEPITRVRRAQPPTSQPFRLAQLSAAYYQRLHLRASPLS